MKKVAIVMTLVTALLCVFLVGCGNVDDGKINDNGTTKPSTSRNEADNIVTDASDAVSDVGEGIGDAVGDVGDAVGDVGEGVGEAVSDAGKGLGDGIKDITD